MNFVQQFLSALHSVKLSTAFFFSIAFGAILFAGNAGWIDLGSGALWAPTAIAVAFVISVALFFARTFQDIVAVRTVHDRSGLKFARVELHVTRRMPAPEQVAVAEVFSVQMLCVCTTPNGSAKVIDVQVASPALASHLPVALIATNTHTGGTDEEPRIHAGETWKLLIATEMQPKKPFQWAAQATVSFDLIDTDNRRHRVSGRTTVR